MSRKTPGDFIKKFIEEIVKEDLILKFNQILELIEGPVAILREKLLILDRIGDVKSFLPDFPSSYKRDLTDVLIQNFNEEIQCAYKILRTIEDSIEKLQNYSEALNQKIFEAYQTKDELVLRNLDVISCPEDIRIILIYIKLKASILKYYLGIPYNYQPAKIPLEKLNEHESTALILIKKLEVIEVPLSTSIVS